MTRLVAFDRHSLRGRLWRLSLGLLPLLLVLAGVALDSANARSLAAARESRLQGLVYLILSEVSWRSGQLTLPEHLADPRFDILSGGLYGLVTTPAGDILWRSPSSLALTLPSPASALRPGEFAFDETTLGGHALFATRLLLVWEHTAGGETPFVIQVFEDADVVGVEHRAYRQSLWMALGGLAVAWGLLLVVIIRYGLRPLDLLEAELAELEAGKQDQLAGHYPAEIEALTRRLNQVIRTERQQRERYRSTLADLAHSLKTPLAVMRSVLQDPAPNAADDHKAVLDAQVSRMDQIIGHQLQRAVVSPAPAHGIAIAVLPVLERLVTSLRKIYPERVIRVSGVPGAVAADERDLFELFGNVLDNACKYGRTRVEAKVSLNGTELVVSISDDGPGMASGQWQSVVRRGVRADQRQPGQGIGLAVAADILDGLGGYWRVETPSEGGMSVVITLPVSQPAQ